VNPNPKLKQNPKVVFILSTAAQALLGIFCHSNHIHFCPAIMLTSWHQQCDQKIVWKSC